MVSATILAGMLAISGAGGSHVSLLYFTSDNCPACRSVRPSVQRLVAAGYPVSTINIDREPDLARQFRIQAIPTFVLMRDGEELERITEAASQSRLVQMFSQVAPPAQVAGSAVPADGRLQRAQSPAGRGGFQLPRPFASLARGFGQKRAPEEESLVQIEQSPAATEFAPPAPSTAEAEPPVPSASFAATPAPPERRGFTEETPVRPRGADVGSAPRTERELGATRLESPANGTSLRRRALSATVRLRVDDLSGHAIGTGTIIDTHGGESLVITCGHLFRDSSGRGRIAVDVFVDGAARTVPGTLIRYDLDRDLGFVAIPAMSQDAVMKVAPAGYPLERGQTVFSVGCDQGQDPSVRDSRITGIDRYVGAPNIEVAGQPVEGRSGGGLFSADGYLIGVCNAADKRDNEGVFASLPAVQWELDRIGQRRIYAVEGVQLAQPTRQAPAADRLASVPAPAVTPASLVGENRATREPRPATTPRSDRPLASTPIPVTPPRAAVAIEPAPLSAADGDTEVICIVRSRANPQGTERLLVLDRPSAELLNRLSHESRGGSAAELAERNTTPVVRAQSDRP